MGGIMMSEKDGLANICLPNGSITCFRQAKGPVIKLPKITSYVDRFAKRLIHPSVLHPTPLHIFPVVPQGLGDPSSKRYSTFQAFPGPRGGQAKSKANAQNGKPITMAAHDWPLLLPFQRQLKSIAAESHRKRF